MNIIFFILKQLSNKRYIFCFFMYLWRYFLCLSNYVLFCDCMILYVYWYIMWKLFFCNILILHKYTVMNLIICVRIILNIFISLFFDWITRLYINVRVHLYVFVLICMFYVWWNKCFIKHYWFHGWSYKLFGMNLPL